MKAHLIATSKTHGANRTTFNIYVTVDGQPTRYDWSTDNEHGRERWCRFLDVAEVLRDAEHVLER